MDNDQLVRRPGDGRLNMESDHALSQEAIDALFQSQSTHGTSNSRQHNARLFDFRRTDRIPKEQIRALRAVHDTFARSLASSLSAYLRTYVTVNLISVEQLAYREFASTLPSPTCISVVEIEPFEGVTLLELNPSLAFPLIELLLGGGKVKPIVVNREMTAIEQRILDDLVVLILQNLALSWQSVATVKFRIDSHETEPAMVQVLGPNEAIVVIASEIQIGETSGMMNIGIPANIVKLLRQKFDQQWNVRKSALSEDEGARVLTLVRNARLMLEARLEGSTISVRNLLDLKRGDVLQFDKPVTTPVTVSANGVSKWNGSVGVSSGKKAVAIEGFVDAASQSTGARSSRS